MVTRRQVLVAGGAVAAGGVLAGCAGGSTSGQGSGASAGTTVASVAEVPVAGGVVNADAGVVVVQPEAGQIKAFTAVCPHQGCLVSSVEGNEIICACHGSVFSAVDGSVVRGPARSGLDAVAVTVDGDTVTIA